MDIHLSPREERIVSCVMEGLTNQQIADRFGTSIHAVKDQLTVMMRKTGAKNRTQLAMALWRKRREQERRTA